ncbi:MAG: hypothetical protein U0Z53_01430 [Blastocatellia bacterium]
MPVQKKLNPGQPGTQKLLALYVSRLPSARYRCDPARQTSVKILETVVEESDRQPRPRRLRPEQLVAIRIGWKEADLTLQIRQAGAMWNPADRTRESYYAQIVRPGLTERLVKKASNTGKSRVSSIGNRDISSTGNKCLVLETCFQYWKLCHPSNSC